MSKQVTENISEEQLPAGWDITLPGFLNPDKFHRPRLTIKAALIYVIVISFLTNQYLMQKLKKTNNPQAVNSSTSTTSVTKPLTAFDQQLIDEQKRNGTEVSVYGSQHVHADLGVYINGQELNFAKPENYVKSRFIHIENNPKNEKDSGSVLHLHAKNVPLRLFFTSIGMNLEKDSLTLQDGQILKDENEKSLKFYLDGKKVDELGNYTFQNLDKLLISYGPDNDPDIARQISSVSNFAKDH